jgi:hypothetical protein
MTKCKGDVCISLEVMAIPIVVLSSRVRVALLLQTAGSHLGTTKLGSAVRQQTDES